jgi:hypothetical protein
VFFSVQDLVHSGGARLDDGAELVLTCLSEIGRLEKTVIDSPDPRALPEFYCQVLGMRMNKGTGDWVVFGSDLSVRGARQDLRRPSAYRLTRSPCRGPLPCWRDRSPRTGRIVDCVDHCHVRASLFPGDERPPIAVQRGQEIR